MQKSLNEQSYKLENTNFLTMLIKTENLFKIFHEGKTNEFVALKNINIEIPKNKITLLQGASGSGKTTLLSVLATLTKPTSGEYFFENEKIGRWSENFLTDFRRKNIGLVFQHFNLLEGLNVFDNISLPLLPYLSQKNITKKVHQIAEKIQITHKLDTPAYLLSGGEKQRTAIARALVNDPIFILADEPTAHLDYENAKNVLSFFNNFPKENKTLLITTHDPRVREWINVDKELYL